MDLQLVWTRNEIYWHFDGAPDWIKLDPAAQFPDFSQTFDQHAPDDLRGCAPPFLTVLPEPGTIQIWTGLMARTAPDWSLLIRAPVNLPPPGGYTHFEGVVETDVWFGPLFTNLRLTQTNQPIRLSADFPLLQVQPLPRIAYAEQPSGETTPVGGMREMTEQDWAAYRDTIVVPNQSPERPFGAYAVAVRKRRKGACPFSGARASNPEMAA